MDSLPTAFKALKEYKQFIICKYEPNGAKYNKVPIDQNTRMNCNAHDPVNWMSAENALITAKSLGENYGIGFVFTKNDPFWFLDIDNCVEGAQWSGLATEMLRLFNGALIEVSHSSKGLHIIGSGNVPSHTSKNTRHNIEFYTEKRFVALTGTQAQGDAASIHTEAIHHLVETYFKRDSLSDDSTDFIIHDWNKRVAQGADSPCDITDDEALIIKMRTSKSAASVFDGKASFDDLWSGNEKVLSDAYPSKNDIYDRSVADAALMKHLAWWTGNDCDRILRLASRSNLQREKWGREDYLKRTILFVCKMQTTFFQDKKTPANSSTEPVTTSSRFAIVSAAKFASLKSPPWIIKGILPRAELAMVYGASGSGKSFLVLDLAFSIARGINWCDFKVRQGRVVYIAAEGAGGMRKRIDAYANYYSIDLSSVALDIIPAAPNFLGQNDLSEISENIGQATVIILDTLACIAAGGDENSSTDMGKVLANCKLLHENTGALVMLVHHMGKDSGKGARGWSGIRAAVDAEIEVTSLDDGLKIRITKLKDGEEGKIYSFRRVSVNLGVDEDGDPINSCVIEYLDSYKKPPKPIKGKWCELVLKVLKQLTQDGKIAVEDVIKHVINTTFKEDGKRDYRRLNIKRALTALEKAGHFKINNQFIFTSADSLAATVFTDGEHEQITSDS